MANVSISKAAKLAGVSRSTLYSTYINKGAISVSADARGRKFIDTSELLRVFGALQPDTVQDSKPKPPPTKSSQVSDTPDTVQNPHTRTGSDSVNIELRLVREQLAEAKQQMQAYSDRENWYQSQIKTLTDTVKLLEDKRPKQEENPRRWWQVLWK
ncbi:MAG: Unknown protein [uncultured Thiotrichaceae bacterium]|uniref:DNA-binding protein n=1 Tax=uncultured Thiotrichaceae bacterium TaxID=298394 RepID=A0A6S6SAH4_9GAMM|nr:MAG: Unknown protein [uncultured Thiotrichaceae bacterium]